MLKETGNLSAEIQDQREVLERMRRAGLYTGGGCSVEQKKWIKERDEYRCQFSEYRHINGKWEWQQCERQENPNLPPVELRQARGRQRWQLEVHHIYPQSQMKVNPAKHGGEQPANLVTLCAGLPGNTGHHDLMSPGMIIAKMMYSTDHTSFEKWLHHIREAEQKGMQMHNTDWDGMMKMIAKQRTTNFLKVGARPFPYKQEARSVAGA